MEQETRDQLIKTLGHIRNAMVAAKYEAPTLPALQCAERSLLQVLFPKEEISEYLRLSDV